jgi:hypothetical protein
MRRTTSALAVIAALAWLIASATVLAVAGPAAADTIAVETPPVVVAQDTEPAPATVPADVVGIDTNIVGGLTVTGHQGKRVTAAAKGRATRAITVAAGMPAVLKGLAPGVRYTVRVGGQKVATTIPLAQVGAASGLRVETTGTRSAVQLSWTHAATQHEGDDVTFEVTATPLLADGTDGAAVITATATGTTTTLTGLDTNARYRFAVTPRNTASAGRTSAATMTTTLGALTGTVATTPAPAPSAEPAAVTPAPTPAPAPGPSTRTIYVCPDGYVTAGDSCTHTKAYTFHTKTLAYTYHTGVIGSHVVTHPPTHCDYLPNPNSPTGLDIYCTGGYDETVLDYGQVKDATPTGYTDTGTAWTRQVKDTAPAGYVDTGTAWVKTVPKVATVVPA